VREERERSEHRVQLMARYRYAPSLIPAMVGLLLFYLALVLGAAVAVGLRALLHAQ
jgi:hypothetical protein